MNYEGEVLLVEDNSDDVQLAVYALEEVGTRSRIHIAQDGAEALKFLFSRGVEAKRHAICPVRLILLDLKMRSVSGHEVLEQVRKDHRTSHVPVVVMSASNQERDLVESYRLGANSYIVKPMDFEEFVGTMRTVARYWLSINHFPAPVKNDT